jgi:hypothetical protein
MTSIDTAVRYADRSATFLLTTAAVITRALSKRPRIGCGLVDRTRLGRRLTASVGADGSIGFAHQP